MRTVQLACYMGAAANLVLMLVLLIGKFVWFRPGAHEVASWIVTGVELLVVILNMIISYQLASGQPLQSLIAAWYYFAPVLGWLHRLIQGKGGHYLPLFLHQINS